MAGRVQLKQTVNLYQGSNTINVALPSGVATGMYVLEVSTNKNFTGKFIKQ